MVSKAIKNIVTEQGESEFQIRFLKEEAVGLITTKNGDNYLILDSIDYWYDLIQERYPKKKKCSCKNEWFSLKFIYSLRPGTADYKEIRVETCCTLCNKTSNSLHVDLDYSGTDHLFKNPITFCANPNIKYNYAELSSYWLSADLEAFLFYIFNELRLNVYCWFFKFPENIRKFEKISYEKALEIITVNHRYLDFFFSQHELEPDQFKKGFDEKGIYVDSFKWRKLEIIHLSAPIVMSGYGCIYFIHFCNQYLDKDNVIDKSKAFEAITSNVSSWLKMKFVTKRGKNCFDGAKAYERYISNLSVK